MNGDHEILVTAFEAGVLMGIIAEQRAKVPQVWRQLVALQKQFRAEAGVRVEDLPDGMAKLTEMDGLVIIREKYPWE